MNACELLIIDPQNDFLDIDGAALPVAGADADMTRLAGWLAQHQTAVRAITVTLDSHPSVGIERTSFWLQADGSNAAPFSVVTAAAVRAGQWRPRDAARTAEVLAYLDALEAPGQRQLVVWPVHCVLGTWGHNIHTALARSIAAWEMHSGKLCDKVLKGMNPMTEQYSAFRAEVPRTDDPRTALNRPLMARLAAGRDTLLVAGEALSHCVAASVQDLLDHLPPERLRQTVLLTDCMSPVAGFEAAGQAFLTQARAAGVRTATLAELPGLALP
jgi:nicotinamidase-related amidase